ncbi:hypothetical protein GCK32_021733 [Trichostrongylus colubriformis]|uniref:Uncharacterized protein n=1 Tax=Trichostrongylus colubriformis TaxID=6319 RepID=A0AAN8FBG4_TRICO
MAAMAVATNRFSPPDIVLEMRPEKTQDFASKITAADTIDHVVADRNTLLGNEIGAREFCFQIIRIE